MEDPGQAREMTDEHHLAGLIDQAIANPLGWIGWLESADRRELSLGTARRAKGFRRLARPQLAAVPDYDRPHAPMRGRGGQGHGMRTTGSRERTLRVHVGLDGVGVMNEVDHRRVFRAERCRLSLVRPQPRPELAQGVSDRVGMGRLRRPLPAHGRSRRDVVLHVGVEQR